MMECLRFTAKTKTLELTNIPIPSVTKPDDVLVKVFFSGICGTDVHIIQGEFPCNPDKPVILGHEFSGIVEDIGCNVKIVKEGDKVSVDPNAGCRKCKYCRLGKPHYCSSGSLSNTIGIYKDGGWAQYALVPVFQVHKVPDTISLQQAALTEPLSCIAHGLDLINPIVVGTNILVQGAGIIGNLFVCVLHLQGHKTVTVVETNLTRLNMLQRLNTGYSLVTPDDLARNQQSDPDYLFDLVIDCTGNPVAIEKAVDLLQKGGKLCCFGVAPPHGEVKIKPFDIYWKELTIVGVLVNPFTFPKSIAILEAMGERYLNYDNLGIQTFTLKQYQEALELLRTGSIAKAVFTP